MTKTPAPATSASPLQADALAIARRVQKPGQTKEQTKLIAQGIAKGIEQYKRQQSAKLRERDKARKRHEKQRLASGQHPDPLPDAADVWPEADTARAHSPLWVAGSLFAVMALLHASRLVTGWTLILGDWPAPVWLSTLAAGVSGGLALWLWHTAYRLR